MLFYGERDNSTRVQIWTSFFQGERERESFNFLMSREKENTPTRGDTRSTFFQRSNSVR